MQRTIYRRMESFAKMYGRFFATDFCADDPLIAFFRPRKVVTNEALRKSVADTVLGSVLTKFSECGNLKSAETLEFEFSLLVATNCLMWSTMSYHRDVSSELAGYQNTGVIIKAVSEIGLELVQYIPVCRIGRFAKLVIAPTADVATAGATTYAATGDLSKTLGAVALSVGNQMVQMPLAVAEVKGTGAWMIIAGHQFAVKGVTGGTIEAIKAGDVKDQILNGATSLLSSVKRLEPVASAIKVGDIAFSASQELVFISEQFANTKIANLAALKGFGTDFSFPLSDTQKQADWIRERLAWDRLPSLKKGDKSDPLTGKMFEQAKTYAVHELCVAR